MNGCDMEKSAEVYFRSMDYHVPETIAIVALAVGFGVGVTTSVIESMDGLPRPIRQWIAMISLATAALFGVVTLCMWFFDHYYVKP